MVRAAQSVTCLAPLVSGATARPPSTSRRVSRLACCERAAAASVVFPSTRGKAYSEAVPPAPEAGSAVTTRTLSGGPAVDLCLSVDMQLQAVTSAPK